MPRGVQEKSSSLLDATWQRLCEYLGLSEYEAKVYVALIEAGQSKARTISVMSGVPRTKVYGVLKKLIDTGLVIEVPEEPKRFAPVPPRTAFKTYLKSYQSRVESLVSIVTTLEESFKKAKLPEKLRRGEVWVISGRQRILKKIRGMLSKARRSVDLVTNENGLVLLYRAFNKLFDGLEERSVRVGIVVPDSSNNQHMISELKYLCDIKKAPFELPIIFLCIDKQQFILANLQPDSFSLSSENDKAIFSDDPVLLELVSLLVTGKKLRIAV
ncbi:hypothetical protein B6U79_00260 [Candidatus Bathyarchaeota archaeon ex4484_231]|nr:MAG: hypothetical protein B6U79_00260 [Candidatus Bathyarchaeota archaeon ex4484_231]